MENSGRNILTRTMLVFWLWTWQICFIPFSWRSYDQGSALVQLETTVKAIDGTNHGEEL